MKNESKERNGFVVQTMFRFARAALQPRVSRQAMSTLPTDVWRKRLLYHATKRGMRENEVLLGRFAKANLASMNDTQLRQFEQFLNQYDTDVNKWLLGKEPIPKELDNAMWQSIVKVHC
jgi:antitoxin CptB